TFPFFKYLTAPIEIISLLLGAKPVVSISITANFNKVELCNTDREHTLALWYFAALLNPNFKFGVTLTCFNRGIPSKSTIFLSNRVVRKVYPSSLFVL